mmetsp:Transcript_23393/g.41387  ORF Transcript_23393/g.41387 Transcript_23393/m.41387 type:complete len:253 (-) Transcript_23393:211-969(-)
MVESIQLALILMIKCPPLRRKRCALMDTIRAWSGCATSAKMVSTMPMSMRYLRGWRASSMIGITLVRSFAMLIKSRPDLCENSTAYTRPVGPTRSATWLTVVPLAPPRYSTLLPGAMYKFFKPPRIPAAILLRKGFQTRYSTFSSPTSTLISFSPYTAFPGTRLLVTRASSLPLATNTPSWRCATTVTLAPPFMPPRPPPRPPPRGPPLPPPLAPALPPLPEKRCLAGAASVEKPRRPPEGLAPRGTRSAAQ